MSDKKSPVVLILSTAVLIPSLLAITVLFRHFPVYMTQENLWVIGIYQGYSPFHFYQSSPIQNPVISASSVKDVKADFVADPFMFKYEDSWYMFFEVLNSLTGHGDIGLATSDDGLNWSYKKIVLDEFFHLSYPFVFDWNGQIYMIPESAASGHLRLYRAGDFPLKWEFVKNLLDGQFGDHGLIRHNDTWFLFANSEPQKHKTLRLYYADSLEGAWVEHPQSPIVYNDANWARPGGRMLVYNNKIIRYAQDCDPTYGKSLNAFEITELTRTTYAETPSPFNPILANGDTPWSRHGMHHLDAHKLSDEKWLACVDGYNRQLNFQLQY